MTMASRDRESGMGIEGVGPVLQVHPSRLCNLACAHCHTTSSPLASQTLGARLLAACLEDAAALGYRELAVSGGEPLLYEPLPALLARARALGMLTSLTTNGMLASAERWGRIAPLVDAAAISIDGTPSEHDALRRREGAFAAAVRNLDVIRSSGVPFGLVFTLTRHNVHCLDFVVHLAAEHGARSVTVRPLTLHGRAATDLTRAQPRPLELGFALAEATRLGRELGVAVHVDALTPDQLRARRDALVPARPVGELTAVAPVLVVGADAGVLPLSPEISPSLGLGSLADRRLIALVRDWLRRGTADALAETCARTWSELIAAPRRPAVSWFDEVAARSRPVLNVVRPPLLRACL